MKTPKQRVIYQDDISPDGIQDLRIDFWGIHGYEPTEDELNNFISESKRYEYEDAITELETFFDGKTLEITGELSLWHGHYEVIPVKGNFKTLISKAYEDNLKIKIYDCNGHLRIENCHHDGTNHFELKEIRNGKRVLPRFCEKVWGCKAREYDNE